MGSGAECGQYFWNSGGAQCEEEEDTSKNAGDFAGLPSVNEAVAEHSDGRYAQDCAMNGADATENAGSTEDDRGDSIEFVTGPGVGFGLPEAGGVDDRRECGDEACENVGESGAAIYRNACVASAFWREADGAEGAAKSGSMDEQPDGDKHEKKNRRLSGNAKKSFLTKEKEPGRKVCESVDAMSNRFGETAKE